jgi:hypothetical protein
MVAGGRGAEGWRRGLVAEGLAERLLAEVLAREGKSRFGKD